MNGTGERKLKNILIALLETLNAHRKQSVKAFQEIGLSEGQPKVLRHLLEEEGIMQKDLAQKCRVEPATMTSLLQKMETDGLIRKEEARVSGGKRALEIFLTEQGRETAVKVKHILEQLQETAYTGFTDTERQQLLSMLERIIKNLEELSET